MKRELINRGKAAVVTVWGMSLITTNANPKLWQIALISIAIFETILLIINTYERETRRKQRRRNIAAGKEDMRRLEKERILWLKREAS